MFLKTCHPMLNVDAIVKCIKCIKCKNDLTPFNNKKIINFFTNN